MAQLGKVLDALLEKELITQNEMNIIVFNLDDGSIASETHKFIVKRVKVMLENVVEQAMEVN